MKPDERVFLSDRERAIVCELLQRHAATLGTVKVFGSRVTGRARRASDLDLVVFPPAPVRELAALRSAFEESELPITVDVLAWEAIDHQALREEIARHAIPFFEDRA